MSKLTPRIVKELLSPGSYQDGRGLFIKVSASGRKAWIFRYMFQGKRHDLSLGSYPALSLREARLQADSYRLQIARGSDPLAERRNALEQLKAAQRQATTFETEAERFIKAHTPSWSPRHALQWQNSLARHVYPRIGLRPIASIDTDDLLAVLGALWSEKPVTASRVRNRIELILDAARARQLRTGENPARWRGHLDKLLPRQKQEVQPFAALPAEALPSLLHRLDSLGSPAARACELLILTALRSGEVCGARWEEFDLEARIWTIPARRMKARRPHRVPLTEAMLRVLEQLRGRHHDYVFLNARRSGPLPGNALRRVLDSLAVEAVPHGFRSTFRTWAAEHTHHPREVCEMALAHRLESRVEAAYNRGDLLEKRRLLMEDWSRFACGFEPLTKALSEADLNPRADHHE